MNEGRRDVGRASVAAAALMDGARLLGAALSALKQLSEQGLDPADGPIKVENGSREKYAPAELDEGCQLGSHLSVGPSPPLSCHALAADVDVSVSSTSSRRGPARPPPLGRAAPSLSAAARCLVTARAAAEGQPWERQTPRPSDKRKRRADERK
ncbi:hypothetical protein ANANG_G00079700 [Anguilla anguilla]|uniref:Uncharacterized protein n=1 Tax=Anguilla anguilla TaxID=7936 RepID=A0A9D3S021_ANGAN|nr:hypothetical protein ANANG_G00079700 [Anguilla anguilla]